MAIEAKRGCGFRKKGGLYLVSKGQGLPCGRLPIPLDVCPTCHHGWKQSRGWTWIDLTAVLRALPPIKTLTKILAGGMEKLAEHGVKPPSPEFYDCGAPMCIVCPLSRADAIGKAGLLWVGERFYRTPEDFSREAFEQGISRRISAIPRGFKVGETWVLLAHPKTIKTPCPECVGYAAGVLTAVEQMAMSKDCKKCGGKSEVWIPGIFRVFKPDAIEKLIGSSEATPETIKELTDKGITPVIVPDDDPDHKGSVFEKEEDEEQIELVVH